MAAREFRGRPGARPRARGPRGPLATALALALAFPASAAPVPAVGPTAPAQEAGGPLAGVRGGSMNEVAYRIRARLDEVGEDAPEEARRLEQKRVSGRLELDWTNAQDVPTSELWFHLYLNAFANNRSTHLLEAKGQLRGVEIDEGWGWSRVESLRVRRTGEPAADAADVLYTLRYARPDQDEEARGATAGDDRTVFVVDLPFEVGPGERVTVELEWDSLLPRVRRRTGSKGDFLLVAQWFPKLGVFEGDRGWNCHQFHQNTEFYADYGTYDVVLDLPAEYAGKVGGSGVLETERDKGDGRIEARFLAPSRDDRLQPDHTGRAPRVHDFTWTADPDFVVELYKFEFASWAESFPGEVERARELLGPDVDLELGSVDVTVLIQPERAAQADRHFRATAAALFFYGLWYGEYPFEHITVVDPAWGASAAGGMEYPTLFTCGTRLFTTPDMHVPESVTVHECGHQFFYGLVGNNEFEAAWLDEGLNSFTDSEVLWRAYGARRGTTDFARVPVDGVGVGGDLLLADLGDDGPGMFADALRGRGLPLPLDLEARAVVESGLLDRWRTQPRLSFVQQFTDPRQADRSGYLRDPATDPIETRAWEYADRDSYRTNSYPRTAVALRSLGGVIGHGPFLRGMRRYAEEWRYRHPYPEDFYATFQLGAGVDCQWYFDELFRGTGTVDWSVEVEQQRRPEARGYVQRESGEFIVQPDVSGPADGEDHPEPWLTEVMLRREGALRLPLPVRLTWQEEDGTTAVEELVWTREQQGASTWRRLAFEGTRKLVAVELDPEHAYYLDRDRSNDSWYEATDALVGWRWGERALAQFQRTLFWASGLGG